MIKMKTTELQWQTDNVNTTTDILDYIFNHYPATGYNHTILSSENGKVVSTLDVGDYKNEHWDHTQIVNALQGWYHSTPTCTLLSANEVSMD